MWDDEKRKAWWKKYNATPKRRKYFRERSKTWKRKRWRRHHDVLPHVKESQRKYWRSPRGRERRKAFENKPERKGYLRLWRRKAKARRQRNRYMREWRVRNHLRWKELASKSYRKTHEFMRKRLLEFFGSCCVNCGFSDWRALQVDHIKAVGAKRKRWTLWKWLKMIDEQPDFMRQTFQLLCANCNWIKRWDKQELPPKTSEFFSRLEGD